MTFKSFSLGLLASFMLPWLLIVVVPHTTMQCIDPVEFNENDDGRTGVYIPSRPGRIADGAKVYAANGCYVCHTQLIRPTYVGLDTWRDGWAGRSKTADNPDTRRETTVFDYNGEDFAQIGLNRIGPDLSNVGHRVDSYVSGRGDTAEQWLYRQLFNARLRVDSSGCPSGPQFFELREKVGQGRAEALSVAAPEGLEFVPNADARALASYLISLKKDDTVPYSMNYRADKKRAIEQ